MMSRKFVTTICSPLVVAALVAGFAGCSNDTAKSSGGGKTSVPVATGQTSTTSPTSILSATATSTVFNSTAGIWILRRSADDPTKDLMGTYSTKKYLRGTMVILLSPSIAGGGRMVLEATGVENIKDYDGLLCGTWTVDEYIDIICQTDVTPEMGATLTAQAYDENGNPIATDTFIQDVVEGFKASLK